MNRPTKKIKFYRREIRLSGVTTFDIHSPNGDRIAQDVKSKFVKDIIDHLNNTYPHLHIDQF